MSQLRTDSMKEFERAFCRDYILKHHKSEYEKLRVDIHDLMNQTFIFNGNWDMEPCPVRHFVHPMNWEEVYGGDPEWAYMLNRQEYLLKLILAYIVEGDLAYLDKVKVYLFDWIDQVPLVSPTALPTRTLDTGIRCITWLRLLLYLSTFDFLSQEELDRIAQSIKEQVTFLRKHYRLKYTLSNWGVLQTVAILLASHLLGEDVISSEDRDWAFDELQAQLQLQVLEDGSQFEQSILYHVEVYRAVLELAYFVPSLKEIFSETLEKMTDYLEMMTGPDGQTLAFGDSDKHFTSDMLNLACLVLEDERRKQTPALDLENVLLTGRAGIERFESYLMVDSQPSSSFFKDSGHVCIKGQNTYTFFKSGPLGSAHSHSDQNSLCFYHKGQAILIDSGRFTYKDIKERYDLKSAWAHSTCILDKTPPEKITGSWDYQTYPLSLSADYQARNGFHYIEGNYQADSKGSLPYVHKRQVLVEDSGLLLVVDTIVAKGEHELTTQFILDDQVVIQDQQVNDLSLYSPVDFQVEDIQISKKYNQMTSSKKLLKTKEFQDFIVDYTLFADSAIDVKQETVYMTDGKVNTDALAFNCKSKDIDLLIFMTPRDPVQGEKCFMVDGIKMRGKCVIFDRKTKNITRLKC